jgi:hypothetical protein
LTIGIANISPSLSISSIQNSSSFLGPDKVGIKLQKRSNLPAGWQEESRCIGTEKELLKIHFVPLKENNSPRFKRIAGLKQIFFLTCLSRQAGVILLMRGKESREKFCHGMVRDSPVKWEMVRDSPVKTLFEISYLMFVIYLNTGICFLEFKVLAISS